MLTIVFLLQALPFHTAQAATLIVSGRGQQHAARPVEQTPPDSASPSAPRQLYLPLITNGDASNGNAASASVGGIGQSFPAAMMIVIASPNVSRVHVPAPAQFLRRQADGVQQVQTANIVVNYNPASCPAAVIAWPAAAQTAFSYAASIWASLISAPQTIIINACWRTDLASNLLGSAGAYTFFRDFSNAPTAGTWYPIALANALANADLNGSDPEIFANFNNNFPNWYFGTDGNTPDTQYDFASVVLHEIGHGLGFAGSMTVNSGLGLWGFGDTIPTVYDRFTQDGNGTALLSYAYNSAPLATALTSGANGVFFNGTNANAANGGTRVPLFAPADWIQGSSYSHLDEVFKGTPNNLMTYSRDLGESEQDPGPVTLGMFKDMGWQTNATPPTPTPTATNTSVSPTATATNTPVGPTATNTTVPPTATATNTPVGPTATNTTVPPTATATKTSVPPTATKTATPVTPATATKTPVPATATKTPAPPTATKTPKPATPTKTPAPATATKTPVPATATKTPAPPTATPTPDKVNGQLDDNNEFKTISSTTAPDATYPAQSAKGVAVLRLKTENEGWSLRNITFHVTKLTQDNYLLNADSGPGQVGSILSVPNSALPGGNQLLDEDETLTQEFRIGLQSSKSFSFKVDVYAIKVKTVAAATDGANAAESEELVGSLVIEADPEAAIVPANRIYLPFINK